MPPSKARQTPSEELQDAVSSAVSSFLKAANHALQVSQEEGREEVRKVNARLEDVVRQRDELRKERDALLQDKHASHDELKSAKCEVVNWQTKAEKAEWVVNEQTASISELRETDKELRGSLKELHTEAQQWKAKFMRVDEERYALSVTNADLLSRQLYANSVATAYQTPLTPRSQDPSSARGVSLGTYVNAAASGNGYLTDGELTRQHALSGTHTGRRKSRQSNAGAVQLQPTKSKVLRRVHVVMDNGRAHSDNGVSVKEEESDESVPLSSPAHDAPFSPSLGDESADELRDKAGGATPRATQKAKGKAPRVSNAYAKPSKASRASASGTNGRRSHSQQSRVRSQSRTQKSASRREVERAENFSDGSDYEEEPDFEQMDEPTRGRGRTAGKKGKERVGSSSNSLGLFDDDLDAHDARPREEEEEEDELMLGSGASRKRAHSKSRLQATASTPRKRGSPYPSNIAGTTANINGGSKRPRKR